MIHQFILPTKIDISSRDVACFAFAAAVHSLLFLWQGGVLSLQEKPGGLGDMLVGVNFMAEVPNYDLPGGGGGAPKAQSFLARVSSLLKGQGMEKIKSQPAGEVPQQNWTKTEPLVDKSFQARQGFQGMKDKTDMLDIAKGKSQEVVMKPSQGNFEEAQPNLKESRFKVAKNDVPFPILKPKTPDALANINAIPVVVGKTTSNSVRSLDGGPGAGPALQSKTFASKGSSSGASFGGLSGASGSSSGSGGLQVAMGGAAAGGAGVGSGLIGAGAGGSGYGTGGSGGGRGGGTGSGTGSSNGSGVGGGGRTWGGGNGGSSEMQTLSRRSVPVDQPAGVGSGRSDHSGFTITGALANRPIEKKVLPPYERDARVALRFRVDWSGKVLDGIVVEISSGNPTYDQNVMSALKQWIFSRLPANRTNEVQEGLVSFVFKGV